MSKIFLKYAFIIASFFVIIQIYLTVSFYQKLEEDKKELLQLSDIKKALREQRYKGKDYKAFAAVIDDSRTYAFGYTSNHRNQKSANQKALFYCDVGRKKFKINKKCRLFNSLIVD